MYVPDEQTTTAYRKAIVAMGFAPQHAALVQVDVARRTGRAPRDLPNYRVTTGIEVIRRGEPVRRALMLWYVYDQDGVLEEAQDRSAIATMLAETVSHLPTAERGELPPLPQWTTSEAAGAKAPVRRAA